MTKFILAAGVSALAISASALAGPGGHGARRALLARTQRPLHHWPDPQHQRRHVFRLSLPQLNVHLSSPLVGEGAERTKCARRAKGTDFKE